MQEGKSLLHTILLSKKQTRLTQKVKMNIELIIDPEFVACIPPLSQDEFEQLEESILSSGKIYNPILVWNQTIVDGHNRYRILKRHPEIEAKIESIAFDSRYDAIAFICENQVSRRELNEVQRAYIIGKRYDADMQSHKAVASRQTRIDGRFHRCSHFENNGSGSLFGVLRSISQDLFRVCLQGTENHKCIRGYPFNPKSHLLPAGRPHRMREYHYSLRSCHRRSRHPVSGRIRNRDESLGGKRRRLSSCRVVALTFGGLPFRADRGVPSAVRYSVVKEQRRKIYIRFYWQNNRRF